MSLLSLVTRARKQDSETSSLNEKGRVNAKSTLPTRLGYLEPKPQSSKLLDLPVEIQQRIYGYVFERWSLAVFRHDEPIESRIDHTFHLRKVGDKLIAGPPGCYLLLVCRTIYNHVHLRYGETCTGTLILGKMKSKFRRNIADFLQSHLILKRFYNNIRRMFIYFSLNAGHLPLNFRDLFPNMKFVDCLVHEGEYGPLVRHTGTISTFLRGNHDDDLVEWTRPIVHHLLGSRSRWIDAVNHTSCIFDDRSATANIKVLGTIIKEKDIILGFCYRWEGPNTRLMAHISRSPTELRFWEFGMQLGTVHTINIEDNEAAIPDRFHWVRSMKW